MANYTIEERDTFDFFCENPELVFEHGQVVCGPSFSPNISVIKNLSGVCKTFVIFRADEPIGYITFVIHQDTTRASIRSAECLAIYTKPEYRGRPSIRLINHALAQLKELGVKEAKMYTPYNQVNQITTYKKMGFTPLEISFVKEL